MAVKTLASDGPDPRTVLPGAMAAPTPRVGIPALKRREDVKQRVTIRPEQATQSPPLRPSGHACMTDSIIRLL